MLPRAPKSFSKAVTLTLLWYLRSSVLTILANRISYHLKGKEVANTYSPPPKRRIRAPSLDTCTLIVENSLTLMGRLTNSAIQRLWALFPFLSNRWNLRGKAVGSYLGKGCFQFKFDYEEDMQKVLDNRPYHFDQWMVILQKWEPIISETFPSLIPFWIDIQGLPKHYWQTEMLRSIGDDLGEVLDIEITSLTIAFTVIASPMKRSPIGSSDYKGDLKRLCSPPVSKATLRNYYSPRDNFVAPSSYSQGSERNYNPSRPVTHAKRSYPQTAHGEKSSSAARSFSQRNPNLRSPSRRLPDSRRSSHSRDISPSHRDHRRTSSPYHHNVQWREKTPIFVGHQHEAFDSSRSRRPPLERVFEDVGPPPPPPIPTTEEVMGELREVTLQYTNCDDPNESAARRRRVLQSESQNLMAETASQMIEAATQANKSYLDSLGERTGPSGDGIQESLSQPPGFSVPSEVPAKKKRGHPPTIKPLHKSPLRLTGAKSKTSLETLLRKMALKCL
ncbi:unnamed protein product [Arabidopsis thaliana]|uniref:(thale cress) hypothetical protein n=1 Tax=Arabidopsis thaliana TaxID=3702 RepID=A0A7G2DYD1_ARATH|nr:unnamed protein product [Arabidopsis thaliana]